MLNTNADIIYHTTIDVSRPTPTLENNDSILRRFANLDTYCEKTKTIIAQKQVLLPQIRENISKAEIRIGFLGKLNLCYEKYEQSRELFEEKKYLMLNLKELQEKKEELDMRSVISEVLYGDENNSIESNEFYLKICDFQIKIKENEQLFNQINQEMKSLISEWKQGGEVFPGSHAEFLQAKNEATSCIDSLIQIRGKLCKNLIELAGTSS